MVNLAKKILSLLISLTMSASFTANQNCDTAECSTASYGCEQGQTCTESSCPKSGEKEDCPACEVTAETQETECDSNCQEQKENAPTETVEANEETQEKPQNSVQFFSDWIRSFLKEKTRETSPQSEPRETAKPEAETLAPSVRAQEILRLVNIEREKVGLKPLRYCTEAQAAADLRAKEITVSFSHTRPDGRTCFTVFDDFGIKGSYMCAENIACGYPSAEAVMKGWMNSPGHRANILSENATALAVGIKGNCYAQTFAHDYKS